MLLTGVLVCHACQIFLTLTEIGANALKNASNLGWPHPTMILRYMILIMIVIGQVESSFVYPPFDFRRGRALRGSERTFPEISIAFSTKPCLNPTLQCFMHPFWRQTCQRYLLCFIIFHTQIKCICRWKLAKNMKWCIDALIRQFISK